MLVKEIATALKQGKRTFVSGMARGSDIFAAELVLDIVHNILIFI